MKKQSLILKSLKANAPNFSSIDELCAHCGTSQSSFYAYTKDNIKLRDEIYNALAKRFTLKKIESDGIESLITISIREAQNANNNHFSDEERKDITDVICYAVEKGIAVTEVCQAVKIHPSTFFKWVNPESPIAFYYATERYKAAREAHKLNLNDELIFAARQALRAKLNDRKTKSTVEVYEMRGADEVPILKERRESEKTHLPDMSAIALTLNNLDLDFRKATAGGQMLNDDTDFRNVTDEELEVMLEEERQRGALLRGEKKDDNG